MLLGTRGAASVHGLRANALSLSYTSWSTTDKGASLTLSNSNLTATAGANFQGVRALAGKTVGGSGKLYFEINHDTMSDQDDPWYGIATANATRDSALTSLTDAAAYVVRKISSADTQFYKRNNGSQTGMSPSATTTIGQKFMCAFDVATGKLWFGYNGTWFDSGDPASGTNPAYTVSAGTYYPFFHEVRSGHAVTANFGASAFAHTPPSGFTGWTETTPTWQTIYNVTLGSVDTLAAGYTGRLYIDKAALTTVPNATKIRVTLKAGASNWPINVARIGNQNGSGSVDLMASPSQLLFGGSASVTISAGATQVSDDLTFAWDFTKGLVVPVYNASGGHSWAKGTSSNAGDKYKSGDDTSTVTTSGYSADQIVAIGIQKVEVFA